MRCIACGKVGSDPCHIRSRGAGGADVFDNVMALCRSHHIEQHSIGWSRFSAKYESVLHELSTKGWVFDAIGKIKKFSK